MKFSSQLFQLLIPVFVACTCGSALLAQSVPKGEFPKTIRSELGTSWTISGVVKNELGLPIRGAKVTNAYGSVVHPMGLKYHRKPKPIDQTKSDPLGNYAIRVSERNQVVIEASGFAPAFYGHPEGSQKDFTLERGREIRGTIFGLDGTPAKGIKVTPVNWLVPLPRKHQYDPPVSFPDHSSKHYYAQFPDEGKSRSVVTDEDGTFRLPHMPTDYRVALAIEPTDGKGEVVFVRSESDFAEKDFTQQILKDNDFEFDISPCPILKISATDEQGDPQKIKRVLIVPITDISNQFDFRREIKPDTSNASIAIGQYKNGAHVFVEPMDEKRLLGKYLTIPTVQENDLLTQEVVFQEGITIEGKVIDENNLRPISGAPIGWISVHQPDQRHINQNFPVMDLVTDRNGQFRFAVPEEECVVGINGPVDDYLGLTCGLANYELLEDIIPDSFQSYATVLTRTQLTNEPTVEFRLKPSIDARFTVTDAQGQPSSNAVLVIHKLGRIIISRRVNSSGVSFSSGTGKNKQTVMSDNQGTAIVKSVYSDVLHTHLAKKLNVNAGDKNAPQSIDVQLQKYNLQRQPFGPVPVGAFSNDGLTHGHAKIVPPKDSNQTMVEISIALQDGGDVFGRIVSQTGQAVENLHVQASSEDQLWKTQTRSDGWFKMEGVRPGEKFRWRLDRKRVKERRIEMTKLAAIQVESSRLSIVGEIIVDDYTALAEPFPPLELDGLDNETALSQVVKAIVELKQRIPETSFKASSYSSSDPLPMFKTRLVSHFKSHIIELANRSQGSEFEFKTLCAACDNLLELPQLGGALGRDGHQLGNFCRDRLLKNHARRDEAQRLILRLTMAFARMTRIHEVDTWSEILDHPVHLKTKAACATRMFQLGVHEVRQHCETRLHEKMFQDSFRRFKKTLTSVVQHIDELDPKVHKYESESFRRSVGYAFRVFDSSQWTPQQKKAYVKLRADKVLAELKQHQSKLDAFLD